MIGSIGRTFSILCVVLAAIEPGLAADVSVLGGLTREATLEPGAEREGKILLRNNAAEPLEVKVYQTDYLFRANGENVYGEPGTVPRSNAGWITLTPTQFVIPVDGTAAVHYSMRVPDGKELVGTYWSILMVERVQMPEPLSPDPDNPQISVQTVMRYGIQMVTHIGQSGTRDIRFAGKRLVSEGGERALQIDVENTGERLLRPTVWAELYDADGVSIGRFDGGRLRIYPTCSARYHVDLSQLPPGQYSALVVADNGDDHVFGAQWKLHLQ